MFLCTHFLNRYWWLPSEFRFHSNLKEPLWKRIGHLFLWQELWSSWEQSVPDAKPVRRQLFPGAKWWGTKGHLKSEPGATGSLPGSRRTRQVSHWHKQEASPTHQTTLEVWPAKNMGHFPQKSAMHLDGRGHVVCARAGHWVLGPLPAALHVACEFKENQLFHFEGFKKDGHYRARWGRVVRGASKSQAPLSLINTYFPSQL